MNKLRFIKHSVFTIRVSGLAEPVNDITDYFAYNHYGLWDYIRENQNSIEETIKPSMDQIAANINAFAGLEENSIIAGTVVKEGDLLTAVSPINRDIKCLVPKLASAYPTSFTDDLTVIKQNLVHLYVTTNAAQAISVAIAPTNLGSTLSAFPNVAVLADAFSGDFFKTQSALLTKLIITPVTSNFEDRTDVVVGFDFTVILPSYMIYCRTSARYPEMVYPNEETANVPRVDVLDPPCYDDIYVAPLAVQYGLKLMDQPTTFKTPFTAEAAAMFLEANVSIEDAWIQATSNSEPPETKFTAYITGIIDDTQFGESLCTEGETPAEATNCCCDHDRTTMYIIATALLYEQYGKGKLASVLPSSPAGIIGCIIGMYYLTKKNCSLTFSTTFILYVYILMRETAFKTAQTIGQPNNIDNKNTVAYRHMAQMLAM